MINAARLKVEQEGKCRVCGVSARYCDAAHTVDRSLSRSGFNNPDLIVPLCSAIKGSALDCHGLYDRHQIDLLPFLSNEEQAAMVLEVGMARAWRRATGTS
jgi:hypothetical protein